MTRKFGNYINESKLWMCRYIMNIAQIIRASHAKYTPRKWKETVCRVHIIYLDRIMLLRAIDAPTTNKHIIVVHTVSSWHKLPCAQCNVYRYTYRYAKDHAYTTTLHCGLYVYVVCGSVQRCISMMFLRLMMGKSLYVLGRKITLSIRMHVLYFYIYSATRIGDELLCIPTYTSKTFLE